VGASSLHWLHHFVRGQGSTEQHADNDRLYRAVTAAVVVAEQHGLPIDNLASLAAQVFSPPGTRHDLSNAGWQSLALGADGIVYPSPALVGLHRVAGGPVTLSPQRPATVPMAAARRSRRRNSGPERCWWTWAPAAG